MRTKAFLGAYDENPFRFEHFNLNRYNLIVNSARVPTNPYRPNFEKGKEGAMRMYLDTDRHSGKYRTNCAHSISYFGFTTDRFISPLDLCPDLCNSQHRHAGREGVLEAELGWAKALEVPITVVVLMKFDQVVTVDPLLEGGETHEQLY